MTNTKDIIGKLFENEICPDEYITPNSREYCDLNAALFDKKTELIETMDDRQKAILSELMKINSDITIMEMEEAYRQGFRTCGRMLFDIMDTK